MNNSITWILTRLKRLNDFIWHTPLTELSRGRTLLIKQVRIILLTVKGFNKDKVQLRASALTFYSLLSVIPMIAIAFAIAKGFNLDSDLENLLSEKLKGQTAVFEWLLSNARSALEKTQGAYLAAVGVVILFWSVMSLLNHIENSFNHIWQIRTARPWTRKFTDYLTIMLIAPIFISFSGSINVFISTRLPDFLDYTFFPGLMKSLVSFLIKLAPYFTNWTALTILFIIMPNSKVKIRPALVSGIIIGSILQVLQYYYFDFQYGITKLNAIYGGFIAMPLFIIWLQSSWTIILLGAELSFANQNISRYDLEAEALNISHYQKSALVLLIMQLIIKNFEEGNKPVSVEYIARSLKIPVRLSIDILQDLSSVRLVSEIHESEHKERLYQPAIDINRITVSYVLSRLDRNGIEYSMDGRSKDYDKVIAMLDKFERIVSKSDLNVLIKNL